jgi:hypothetical protein
MTYARKLALLLFTLWMVLVLVVVFITLQRTHRNLNDLRGHLILQRLLQLPLRLLAPPRAEQQPLRIEATPITSQDGGARVPLATAHSLERQRHPIGTPLENSQLLVASSDAAQRREATSVLQRISINQQATDWCYRLEITGGISGYRQFTLTAPARWVLDLPGSWQIQEQKVQHFSKGPVQSIIVGQHPQHLRVVFLVNNGVSIPAITTEAGQWVVKFTASPTTPHQRARA